MRTSELFGVKNLDFFKLILCPHEQGWLNQFGHFTDKGERI